MTRTLRILLAVSLAVGLGWTMLPAGDTLDKTFKADDAVKTIEVRIDVGEGADLDEPLALDLGLGFPLWLHPVGRKAEEGAPFGAVPQQTTVKADERKIAAGASATFTFALKPDDDGQDSFKMTPQLLAGLRMSDIARVGFTSQASGNWGLAGYEIKINGKAFAAGKLKADQEGKAKLAQDAARQKLADLEGKIAPLETSRSELLDLAKTALATDDDQKQLKDVVAKMVPLVASKRRLEGQLQSLYPWFEDKEFRSPWRSEPLIKSARVTLITATHSDADTQNYVYLHTGGRKYLLGSPATPMTGNAGPQVFTLDLDAGPLTAADTRVWAVGMLGQPSPLAKVPDRWHPQRFRVEIDGKVAYDSEENDLDRKSLDAIRLIPPVHKDQDGQLVKNEPVSRETFVWEAGRKDGLDPDKGTPLPLPDAKDATFPQPETPTPVTDTPDPTDPEAKVDPPTTPDPATPDPPANPDMATPFPGEKPAASDPGGSSGGGGTDGGSGSSGGGSPDLGGTGGGGSSDPTGGASDPSTQPGPATDPGTPPDPTKVPTPAGSAFQVQKVRIIGGVWKADQTFKVVWTVSGDETAVDHYVVTLQPVQPHLDDPFVAEGIMLADNVPRGSRSASGTLGALPMGVDPRSLFLRPVVTAIPVNPVIPPVDPKAPPPDPKAPPPDPMLPPATPNAGTGPARAIFPVGSTVVGQPTLQTPFVWWHTPPPPAGLQTQAISFTGPTKKLARAVWPVNQVVRSDNDVLFDSAFPGRHVGVLFQQGDTVRVEMRIPKAAFAGGKRHFIAHLGFLGEPGAINTVKARIIGSWRTSTDAAAPAAPPDIKVPAMPAGSFLEAAAGDTMKLIDQEFDASTLPAAASYLRVRVYVTGGPFDPMHPPALFGVRLVP